MLLTPRARGKKTGGLGANVVHGFADEFRVGAGRLKGMIGLSKVVDGVPEAVEKLDSERIADAVDVAVVPIALAIDLSDDPVDAHVRRHLTRDDLGEEDFEEAERRLLPRWCEVGKLATNLPICVRNALWVVRDERVGREETEARRVDAALESLDGDVREHVGLRKTEFEAEEVSVEGHTNATA